MRRAWHAADALMRATACVEQRAGDGWNWRGTGFFVDERHLLTCAHVVQAGVETRVVRRRAQADPELPVRVVTRAPDQPDVDPYPLPDVAVLEVANGIAVDPHPVAWLRDAAPGDDLWAYGYPDEYVLDLPLGHASRFKFVGPAEPDQGGARVLRMNGDRVRGGMSGAPVLDLATGAVVGMVKRTQDAIQSIGAFFTPVGEILPAIGDVAAANTALTGESDRVGALATELWGDLLKVAQVALAADQAAPAVALAADVGLTEADLVGDEHAQAARVALELFFLDLGQLRRIVNRLAEFIGPEKALTVFDAIAVCAPFEGEPWIAGDVAAELAAQVELVAERARAELRILDLRGEHGVCAPYVRRGNRRRDWGRQIELNPYGAENEPVSGLPVEMERDLRTELACLSPSVAPAEFLADDLSPELRRRWEDELRPDLVDELRRRCVVGLLPPRTPIDAGLVERLARSYPFVFLTASEEPATDAVRRHPAYRALDPEVEGRSVRRALIAYEMARGQLRPTGVQKQG